MKRIGLITMIFILGIFLGPATAVEVKLLGDELMKCEKVGDEPTICEQGFPGLKPP